jgi:hypothetical protein
MEIINYIVYLGGNMGYLGRYPMGIIIDMGYVLLCMEAIFSK